MHQQHLCSHSWWASVCAVTTPSADQHQDHHSGAENQDLVAEIERENETPCLPSQYDYTSVKGGVGKGMKYFQNAKPGVRDMATSGSSSAEHECLDWRGICNAGHVRWIRIETIIIIYWSNLDKTQMSCQVYLCLGNKPYGRLSAWAICVPSRDVDGLVTRKEYILSMIYRSLACHNGRILPKDSPSLSGIYHYAF